MNPTFQSIETIAAALDAGETTSVALVDHFFERITRYDQKGPALNAIQALNPQARAQAAALDEEREAQGPRSPLHGIPVLVKDNYETVEMPTTAGSKLLAHHHPKRDAALVARLRDAGAVILGKTTMHEFAYGITTVGSGFGFTKNPYDLERNPGGSSGGTGAAIAAGFAVVGMGSDTCGSIRIPAAQNNLVGLRGTQGLSSRRGIVPLSSTQDIGGPIAQSVRDLAIVLDATVGPDAEDVQTQAADVRFPQSYLSALETMRGMRIGVLTDWTRQEDADDAVAEVVEGALEKVATSLDWQLVPVPSPELNASLDRPWNGYAVLIADFRDDIDAYLAANPEIALTDLDDLIAQGAHHPSIHDSLTASASIERELYTQELEQRGVVAAALDALLDAHRLDAFAYPTIRQVAARHGVEQMGTNCRLSANSGYPAISVPAGFTAAGMPVGLEFLAQPWTEQRLLNLAYSVEQSLPMRTPPAATP